MSVDTPHAESELSASAADNTADGLTSVDATLAVSTVAVSICFWCTLLTAAVIYGTVSLAPKLAVWQTVRAEYRQNVRQLVALEEDVEYLERVDKALQTDPEFLQRMTGGRAPDADAEFIPVSGSLLFGQEDLADLPESSSRDQPGGHLSPGLLMTATRRLAADGPLRNGLLILSASLTIFAFAFLNDAGAGFVSATGQLCRRLVTIPIARYTRSQLDQPAEPADDDASNRRTASAPATTNSPDRA